MTSLRQMNIITRVTEIKVMKLRYLMLLSALMIVTGTYGSIPIKERPVNDCLWREICVMSDAGAVSENDSVTSRGNVHLLLTAPVALPAYSVTSTSFSAKWNAIRDASAYLLDVSLDSDFKSFVEGYTGRQVSTTTMNVDGLVTNTMYYYRVRSMSSNGDISANSNVIVVSLNGTK